MADFEQEKRKYILDSLKNLQFGSLVITIHDGQITQVDKTEKNRFISKSKSKTNRPLQTYN